MPVMPVVVLERCDDNPDPAYLIHGRANCPWCGFFCWLGSESVKSVASHQVWPICGRCAAGVVSEENLIGRLDDQ